MNDSAGKCFKISRPKYFSDVAGTFFVMQSLSNRSHETANREMLIFSAGEKGKRTK